MWKVGATASIENISLHLTTFLKSRRNIPLATMFRSNGCERAEQCLQHPVIKTIRGENMKRVLHIAAFAAALITASAFAHHPAADIVDEEIYEMIDSLVADSPHADLDLTDMGGGMTEITLTTRTLTSLENMVDDGLLDYASMLDGDVEVAIDFNDDGSVTMTIRQN